jgi:hypothetical protein
MDFDSLMEHLSCGCRRCRHHRHHPGSVVIMAVPTLAPGETHDLTATAFLADGTSIDDNAVISWRSSDPAIASVLDKGVTPGTGSCTVTGVAEGSCEVIATATDPDGHATDSKPEPVTVGPAPVPDAASVVITDPSATAPAPPVVTSAPQTPPAAV